MALERVLGPEITTVTEAAALRRGDVTGPVLVR